MRSLLLAFLGILAAAAPSLAQGTYVSASLTADVVRFNRSETSGSPDLSGSGEALGFALRIGTPVGSLWGVELEFARPGELENEGVPQYIPLPRLVDIGVVSPGLAVPGAPDFTIFPPISYSFRNTYRNSTLSAGVWARQDLSARVALVYVGGIGFHRTERELTFTYELRPLPATGFPIPIVLPPPTVTNATDYATHPFAGIEGRIRMTEHVELVPGMRLHGLEGGLLIRPSVGLGWKF